MPHLIVTADPVSVSGIQRTLSERGISSLVCESGPSALRILDSRQDIRRVIIAGVEVSVSEARDMLKPKT